MTDKDFIVEEIAISSHTLVGGINFDLIGAFIFWKNIQRKWGFI